MIFEGLCMQTCWRRLSVVHQYTHFIRIMMQIFFFTQVFCILVYAWSILAVTLGKEIYFFICMRHLTVDTLVGYRNHGTDVWKNLTIPCRRLSFTMHILLSLLINVVDAIHNIGVGCTMGDDKLK